MSPLKLISLALCLYGLALRGADPAPNVTFILHLQHADSLYSAVVGNTRGLLFTDTSAEPVDTFAFYLPEPTLCYFMIGEDTSKRFSFYVDLGENQLAVDAAEPRNPAFIKSPINTEYRYWKYKYDSVMSMPYTANALALYKTGIGEQKVSDSIRSLLYQRTRTVVRLEFEARQKLLNSFLTLAFIKTQLEMALREPRLAECSQAELRTLFDKLNPRMKNFPSYSDCLRIFALDPSAPGPPTVKPAVKTN